MILLSLFYSFYFSEMLFSFVFPPSGTFYDLKFIRSDGKEGVLQKGHREAMENYKLSQKHKKTERKRNGRVGRY